MLGVGCSAFALYFCQRPNLQLSSSKCLNHSGFVALRPRMQTQSLGIGRACSRTWGMFSVDAFETLRKKAKARACIEEWLERGAYVGWLASRADRPEIIIGGAG